jgi:hypothetical protein
MDKWGVEMDKWGHCIATGGHAGKGETRILHPGGGQKGLFESKNGLTSL